MRLRRPWRRDLPPSEAHEHEAKLQFIHPGKPVENAHIDSVNGRPREECLNQHAFVRLGEPLPFTSSRTLLCRFLAC